MIEYVKGNVLHTEFRAIMHQVNTKGVFGGGLAKQIKELYPEIYQQYHRLCMVFEDDPKQLVGRCFVAETYIDSPHLFFNLFGEFLPTEEESPFPNGRHTDYDALDKAISEAKRMMDEEMITAIACPSHIGCGLAGGDWNGVVLPMLKKYFEDDPQKKLIIYEYQK